MVLEIYLDGFGKFLGLWEISWSSGMHNPMYPSSRSVSIQCIYLRPDVVGFHSELSYLIGDKFLQFCHISTDGHISLLHGSYNLKEPGGLICR